MHRCQKALWEKNTVRGSPTSSDLVGFSEECCHNLSKQIQVGLARNQDLIGRGSIHTILNVLVACSLNVSTECVRDYIPETRKP